MGVGSNRRNIYTVCAATQGLSNYLNKNFKELDQISVVVGHDCRNNSRDVYKRQLGDSEKPLVVSAILLALKEETFSIELLKGDELKTDGQIICDARCV